MSEMLKNFEEQFLTSINIIKDKIDSVNGSNHEELLCLKKELLMAEKTLKQLEIEAAMLPMPSRSQASISAKNHRSEWQRMMSYVKEIEKKFYEKRNQQVLMGSMSVGEHKNVRGQQLLLDQNAKLQSGVSSVGSTEVMAVETINELKKQREVINKTSTSVREIESGLIASDKIMKTIQRRINANKVAVGIVSLLLFCSFVFIIYTNLSK